MNEQAIAGFPPSPQQSLLWQEDGSFHQCLVAIEDSLDSNTLRDALNRLYERHEILRTHLERPEGMEFPLQIIDEPISQKEILITHPEAYSDVSEIIVQLRSLSIPQSSGLQFQGHLFSTKSDQYLGILLSSICGDAHSIHYLVSEFFAITKEIEIEEEPLQYADLSEWLNGVLEEKNDFWLHQGMEALVVSKSFQTTAQAEREIALKGLPLGDSNKDLEAKLLLSWQILHQKHFGSDRVTYLQTNGRFIPDLEATFGNLEKSIPIKPIDPSGSVVETITTLTETIVKLREWEHDLPSTIETKRSSNPTLRIVNGRRNGGIVWQGIQGQNQALGLTVFILVDKIRLQLDADLPKSVAERLLRQFEVVLTQVFSDVSSALKELQVLPVDELSQVLSFGQGKPQLIESSQTLHELIEAQVKRSPDSIALEFGAKKLTYQELDERANDIAIQLQSYDSNLVGVHVHRSDHLVIALMGVLKSGKAYVPLEPSYPQNRLDKILTDSGLNLILTDGRGSISVDEGVNVLSIKEIPTKKEVPSSVQSDLAYVLYTSGSTGNPKGVAVGHSQVVNHMLWMMEEYPLDHRDVVLQRTPYSFDASVWEIFSPLLQGARLIILPQEDSQNMDRITDLIETKKVTIFQTVPSMLQTMMNSVSSGALDHVRIVFCGGEPLTGKLAGDLLNEHTTRLVNLYGPTECTIQISHFEYVLNDAYDAVPVGKPIHGVNLYVLDDELQLQPIGVSGEVHIAGNCVSQGYLNNDLLTEERFLSDPFVPGNRMFKTGDLGFWNEEGELVLLGREDDQVKLRGHRIELGEIDATVTGIEGIKGSVTVIHGQGEFQKMICYYTVKSDPLADPDVLKQLVARNLPEYMIPTHFILLDDFPLTHHGKVDKKSLRSMEIESLIRGKEIVEPEGEMEETLLVIWRKLLRRDKISVEENFFDAGGHSLMAVSLINAVKDVYDKDFPLSAVFDYPTIREQSRFLENKGNQDFSILTKFKEGNGSTVFLFPPTGGLLAGYAQLIQRLSGHTIYGLQDPGLAGEGIPYESLESLSEIYAKEIRKTGNTGTYILAGWSFGGVLAFETAKHLKEESKIDAVILFDSYPESDEKMPESGMLKLTVAKLLANLIEKELTKHQIKVITSDEQASLDLLHDLAKHAQMLSQNSSREEIERLLQVFQANVNALSQYQASSHTFDVHLFEPKEAVPEGLKDVSFEERSFSAGDSWKKLGKVKTYRVSGHHLNMLSEPHVEQVVNQLQLLLKTF